MNYFKHHQYFRIVSPRPNVFVPIETAPSTPLKRKYPAIKIIGKVAMYEELSKG